MKSNQLQILKNEEAIFLRYFKSRFPLFHNSNLFLRDFQFAINGFFKLKGEQLSYTKAEALTKIFASHLEQREILVPLTAMSWRLNFPEFTAQIQKQVS